MVVTRLVYRSSLHAAPIGSSVMGVSETGTQPSGVTMATIATAIVKAFDAVKAAKLDAERNLPSTTTRQYLPLIAAARCWQRGANTVVVSVGGTESALTRWGHIASDLLDAAIVAGDVDNVTFESGEIFKVRDGSYVFRFSL